MQSKRGRPCKACENAAMEPQKSCNAPCSKLAGKVKVKWRKEAFVDHLAKLKKSG